MGKVLTNVAAGSAQNSREVPKTDLGRLTQESIQQSGKNGHFLTFKGFPMGPEKCRV